MYVISETFPVAHPLSSWALHRFLASLQSGLGTPAAPLWYTKHTPCIPVGGHSQWYPWVTLKVGRGSPLTIELTVGRLIWVTLQGRAGLKLGWLLTILLLLKLMTTLPDSCLLLIYTSCCLIISYQNQKKAASLASRQPVPNTLNSTN